MNGVIVADVETDAGFAAGFRPDQLDGFRIGVTSDRRSEDLIAAFERRGAEVLHAPAIRIAAVDDDAELTRDTAAIIEARPDLLLATTSYGVRRWFEVADAAGLGAELTEVLTRARILVRGPKARGAIRAAGLEDRGMSVDETTASLVDQVLEEGVSGLTIAVQLHGFPDVAQIDRLRNAGAHVLTAAPYRWSLPEDSTRVLRLVDAICTGSVDAVTFTSAPAVDALLATAEQAGKLGAVLDAFANGVTAAAVGPVTAAPLEAAGIRPIAPQRFRMGALIRLVCEHLETTAIRRVATPRGDVELRGRLVVVNGRGASLSPTSLALFRLLLAEPGRVVSRTELATALPDDPDDHAVDMAISRLRRSLPVPDLIATVIKRGYSIPVRSAD
jgi:uroporphyrinogen-III synthase